MKTLGRERAQPRMVQSPPLDLGCWDLGALRDAEKRQSLEVGVRKLTGVAVSSLGRH